MRVKHVDIVCVIPLFTRGGDRTFALWVFVICSVYLHTNTHFSIFHATTNLLLLQ